MTERSVLPCLCTKANPEITWNMMFLISFSVNILFSLSAGKMAASKRMETETEKERKKKKRKIEREISLKDRDSVGKSTCIFHYNIWTLTCIRQPQTLITCFVFWAEFTCPRCVGQAFIVLPCGCIIDAYIHVCEPHVHSQAQYRPTFHPQS